MRQSPRSSAEAATRGCLPWNRFLWHESVNHLAGAYVRDDVHTKSIESFRSLFKRGFHGTYHRICPEHFHRYVREFEGRNNTRDLDTIDQMESLVRGMEGKRPKSSVLTGKETE